MRKLFLTSFLFRTGDSEFKEYRIVAVNNYDKPKNKNRELSDETQVALEKLTAWFGNEFPESTMLGTWVHPAIDEVAIKPSRSGEVKIDRRTHVIEDDRTLNDLLFESFSECLMFNHNGKEYSLICIIAGSKAEGSVDWEWQVFDEQSNCVYKYQFDMYDDRLAKTSADVIDYLSLCFQDVKDAVRIKLK